MTRMTRIGGIFMLTAMLATGPAVQAQTPQKLKIGAVMALTGSLSAYGESSLNGVKLAVEEMNKAGGVMGHPVELVVGDDQTNPQAGVDTAQKLVSIDKVNAIVGALSSGSTIPIASTVTSKAGIPQISGASTSPVITNLADNDMLFRTVPSDAAQGVAMAQVAKEMKLSNVSVIYLNNDYGKGLAESFFAAFKADGGSIASMAPYAEKQASYRGELQKAAQGKPDALVLIAYPGDGIPILRQGLEGGFFKRFLFSDGMKAPEVVKAIGQKYLADSAGTAPEALSDSPTAKSFAEAYRAKYGELPPKPYIDAFYDATILVGLAAEKAKSTDGKAIVKALREIANAPGEQVGPGEFAKAKQLLAQGKEIDYQGAAGGHAFDQNGDVTGTFSHWIFKDDTVQTVKVFEPR